MLNQFNAACSLQPELSCLEAIFSQKMRFAISKNSVTARKWGLS